MLTDSEYWKKWNEKFNHKHTTFELALCLFRRWCQYPGETSQTLLLAPPTPRPTKCHGEGGWRGIIHRKKYLNTIWSIIRWLRGERWRVWASTSASVPARRLEIPYGKFKFKIGRSPGGHHFRQSKVSPLPHKIDNIVAPCSAVILIHFWCKSEKPAWSCSVWGRVVSNFLCGVDFSAPTVSSFILLRLRVWYRRRP